MQPHNFKLTLPRETTQDDAHQAGKDYLENELHVTTHADYSCTGSKPHPTMSGMAVFSYSYKA